MTSKEGNMNRLTNNTKICASDKPVIICPCPVPKRLLTSSNWATRNDSSSVDAILHPEIIFSPHRLKQYEKTKGDVEVKPLLSRNNCYCRCKSRKQPKPSYFKRPNTCISYEALPKILQNEGDSKRKSLVNCVCKLDEGEILKFSGAKTLPIDVGLKYTDQRKKYEEYRTLEEEKSKNTFLEYEDNKEYEKTSRKFDDGDGGDVETILDTQKYATSTTMSNLDNLSSSVHRTRDTLIDDSPTDAYPVYSEWSVPDFRREHYFETHDIGKLKEITGDVSKDDHNCIHQFKLDSGWLPEAINIDSFGRSVCQICGKPMTSSNINLSSFTGDKLSRSKIKNYAEAYRNGLTPTSINLGKGKSRIELLLQEKDVAKFSSYINKVKKPVYTNSLALRHQKLRIK